jgi:hypothetical protein
MHRLPGAKYIEKSLDVRIKYVMHHLSGHPNHQRVEHIVLAAPWSETI